MPNTLIKRPTEADLAAAAENDVEVAPRRHPIPDRRKAVRVRLCAADQATVQEIARTLSGEALICKLLEPRP